MSLISGCIITVLDYLSTDNLSLITEKNDDSNRTSITLKENRKYVIPSFQRELRWQTQNVNTLLFDLSNGPVFLGNIILSIRKGLDVEIIDGQQRTTIIYLIIKAIESKFSDYFAVDSFCGISNESFSSFSDLVSVCFEENKYPNSIGDDLNQLPRFKELWNTIFNSSYLSDHYKAASLYSNLKKSTINVIAEQSDDSSESIRFFLDVNLKGVKLDAEDIFKGYLLSIDNSLEMRNLWIDIKKELEKINSLSSWPIYPLMKLYEHFFVCALSFKTEYQELEFGEDFCLKHESQLESKSFFQGTHILEVIRNRSFLKECLLKLKKVLRVFFEVINNNSPSVYFRAQFHVENEKVDDIQIQNTFLLLKKILEDSEVITKILALKFIISLFDDQSHKKNEYKSIYSISVMSSLFIIFANRKRSEKIYSIVRSNNWIAEVNEWIADFSNSVEMTRGKLGAAYYEPEENEDYSASIRCRSIGMIYNYARLNKKGITYDLKITNEGDLNEYLTNKQRYSLEHFIIPKSGKYSIFVDGKEVIYSIPTSIKKYRNSIFNYIFLSRNLNDSIGNNVIIEKIRKVAESKEGIECLYSKKYFDLISSGDYFQNFPTSTTLTTDNYRESLDSYFLNVFIEDFLAFASDIAKQIIIMEQ